MILKENFHYLFFSDNRQRGWAENEAIMPRRAWPRSEGIATLRVLMEPKNSAFTAGVAHNPASGIPARVENSAA